MNDNSTCLVRSDMQGYLKYYVFRDNNGIIEQIIENTSLDKAAEVFYKKD